MEIDMLTKTTLINMIETADQEKLARIVGRACVALFRRQTEDEKAINAATHNNNRGFTQGDARQGSITAKYFIKHGVLLDWQVNQWLKTDVRGTPRIVKYWKQLAEEAAKKAA
jgi:hypothetical protein